MAAFSVWMAEEAALRPGHGDVSASHPSQLSPGVLEHLSSPHLSSPLSISEQPIVPVCCCHGAREPCVAHRDLSFYHLLGFLQTVFAACLLLRTASINTHKRTGGGLLCRRVGDVRCPIVPVQAKTKDAMFVVCHF